MRMRNDVVGRAVRLLLAALLSTAAFGTPVVRASGASLVLNPSTMSVNPGESFRMDVVLTTDAQTRGVQFGLTYDPSLLQIDSVEPGAYYKSWSDANGGQGAAVMAFQPHNDTGRLAPGAVVLLGGPADRGPNGSGTVLTLQMTARPGASGRSPLLMTDVIISTTKAESLPDVMWTGAVAGVGLGAAALGPPPEPVLAAPPPDIAGDPPVHRPSEPGVLGQLGGLPPLNWFVAGLLAGCVGTTVGFVLLGWLRLRPAPARREAREYAVEQ